MAGAPRTRARYEKVLAAAREAGPNASAISKLAGCDRATAKRLLDEGWPELPWARPIRELLREEGGEARTRAAARAKAEVEAVAEDAAKKREASVEMLAAERQLVAVGRNAVVEMARAALGNRDLLMDNLKTLREDAAKMSIKERLATVKEVRHLFAEIPRLSIAIAREGREHREEQGAAPGGYAPAAEFELGPEDVIATLEDAVLHLAEICRRGASTYYSGVVWGPSDALIAGVRRLARGVGIRLHQDEPLDVDPDDVGYAMSNQPPRRVDAEIVERAREDLPQRIARSAKVTASRAVEREEGPGPAEEPAPLRRVLLLGTGEVDGGER